MKKLSEILKDMNTEAYCKNEQNVQFLALMVSELKYKTCTFVENENYIGFLKTNVTMVITTEELADKIVTATRGVVVTDNPRLLFFEIHNHLQNNLEYAGKRFPTKISESAKIGKYVDIAENNVQIGDNVTIESFVKIYPNVTIGEGSIIRSGAVIGGEGFEFKHSETGIVPVKHLGYVKIGSHVEIQNNTCVDKAVYPWDETRVGDYSKIDNLVHIGHAVKIDDNVMIVANSGIGGRTEIHANTWIGFGATIKNGIIVGKNARANMGSVVTKSIQDNQSVTGNFAIEHEKFIANLKKMS